MTHVWVNIIDGGYNGENTFGGVFSSPEAALAEFQRRDPKNMYVVDYQNLGTTASISVMKDYMQEDKATYPCMLLWLERFELDNLDANGLPSYEIPKGSIGP